MPRKKKKRDAPVRFRLTLAGWLFLGISMLLGVAAVKSQVALMFVVFGAMIGALYISTVTARRMVRSVAARRDMPSRAWQYQTVPLGYHLRNTRRRSCLGLVLRELPAGEIDSVAGFCAHLPGGAVFRAAGRLFARRRGRIALGELHASTTFPFGLVHASKRVPSEASVVVWPARGRLRGRLLHRGAVQSSSAAPSQATGGQDEFFGLREYRPGDNPRWIHWRRSATKATPVVREMTRPQPESLWVVLDTSPGPAGDAEGLGRRERRIRFAGTLIDYAFARGYQVGLALAGRGRVVVHPPAGGRGQRQLLLDSLADVDSGAQGPSASLAQVVGAVERNQWGGSQIVLAAGEAGVSARPAAEALRATCQHLTVITDRDLPTVFEDAAPPEAAASVAAPPGRPEET